MDLLGGLLLSRLFSWNWKRSGFFPSYTETEGWLLGRSDQPPAQAEQGLRQAFWPWIKFNQGK